VVDLAFVIDNSGSIRDNDPPGGNNWQLILNFVKSIINDLVIAPFATRIAVVDFGKFVQLGGGGAVAQAPTQKVRRNRDSVLSRWD